MLVLLLLVIIVFAIVVRCLWKKQQRSANSTNKTLPTNHFISLGYLALIFSCYMSSSRYPCLSFVQCLPLYTQCLRRRIFCSSSYVLTPSHCCLLSNVQHFHNLSLYFLIYFTSLLFFPFTSLHHLILASLTFLNISHPYILTSLFYNIDDQFFFISFYYKSIPCQPCFPHFFAMSFPSSS